MKKRQSFSIQSLTVSSRIEPERLSKSPYPLYLHASNVSSVSSENMDYNNNELNNSRYQRTETDNNVVMQTEDQEREGMQFRLRKNGQDWSDCVAAKAKGMGLQQLSVSPFVTTQTLTGQRRLQTPKRMLICSVWNTPSSDESFDEDCKFIDFSAMTRESFHEVHRTNPDPAGESPFISDADDVMNSKEKKLRTVFTVEQLRELEQLYKTHKYLTPIDRNHLAKRLQLKDRQLKTWFQNRRMKEKRKQIEESRVFRLPTGGVDIAQLVALGIHPPPHTLAGATPVHEIHSDTNVQVVSPLHKQNTSAEDDQLKIPVAQPNTVLRELTAVSKRLSDKFPSFSNIYRPENALNKHSLNNQECTSYNDIWHSCLIPHGIRVPVPIRLKCYGMPSLIISQLYQEQAAVKLEYCRAQVASPMMMIRNSRNHGMGWEWDEKPAQ